MRVHRINQIAPSGVSIEVGVFQYKSEYFVSVRLDGTRQPGEFRTYDFDRAIEQAKIATNVGLDN